MPDTSQWQTEAMSDEEARGRFLGSILGGAVGDALGAPVEFMSRKEIVDRFGGQGITDYAPAYGKLGAITDDTQMTLFTAEGLLRAYVRGCEKGIVSHESMVGYAYLRWLRTQGEDASDALLAHTAMDAPGWLIGHRELHHRRAPGRTCLGALRGMNSPGRAAANNSKGCGGVMRVAPAGLYALNYKPVPWFAFRLGQDLAALTHGHPTGFLPAGVLAVLVMTLAGGASFNTALEIALECLKQEPDHEETLKAIDQACGLAVLGVEADTAIRALGQGWVAEEALAIAVYCVLKASSLREGLLLAVNHDGDSDSTGAIAGNLLGAIYGANAIPGEWLEPLELRDVITETSDDLFSFRSWQISEYGPIVPEGIWEKYPGG